MAVIKMKAGNRVFVEKGTVLEVNEHEARRLFMLGLAEGYGQSTAENEPDKATEGETKQAETSETKPKKTATRTKKK